MDKFRPEFSAKIIKRRLFKCWISQKYIPKVLSREFSPIERLSLWAKFFNKYPGYVLPLLFTTRSNWLILTENASGFILADFFKLVLSTCALDTIDYLFANSFYLMWSITKRMPVSFTFTRTIIWNEEFFWKLKKCQNIPSSPIVAKVSVKNLTLVSAVLRCTRGSQETFEKIDINTLLNTPLPNGKVILRALNYVINFTCLKTSIKNLPPNQK
jgi:hypothetical protein